MPNVTSHCILLLLTTVSLLFSSCYSHCEEDSVCSGLGKGELIVKLPINEDNPYVVVELYKGKFEKDQLIRKDTLYKTKKIYTIQSNRRYAMKAYYFVGNVEETRVIEKELTPTYDSCDCVESDGVVRFDFRLDE